MSVVLSAQEKVAKLLARFTVAETTSFTLKIIPGDNPIKTL